MSTKRDRESHAAPANSSKKEGKKKLNKSLSSTVSLAPTVVVEEETTKRGSALAFQILSKEDTDALLGMTANEMESKLQATLELNPLTDLKDASILDYYVGAMYWAKQQNFPAQKFSGFFTVVYTLLNKIKDERLPFVECVKEFCKLLVGIGVELTADIESGGIEFFDVKEAKAISEYINNTIFQHYKLYEYMFHFSQEEEIVSSDLSVEVPLPATAPFPPPLDEGISEEIFKDFLTIHTPSLSTESSGDLKVEEDPKPLTPTEVNLPPEAADIFSKLTTEDVKSIVDEISSQMLKNFQIGVENKIRQQENNVLAKINKIHNVLSETPREEAAGSVNISE